jgi:hypothetical protein
MERKFCECKGRLSISKNNKKTGQFKSTPWYERYIRKIDNKGSTLINAIKFLIHTGVKVPFYFGRDYYTEDKFVSRVGIDTMFSKYFITNKIYKNLIIRRLHAFYQTYNSKLDDVCYNKSVYDEQYTFTWSKLIDDSALNDEAHMICSQEEMFLLYWENVIWNDNSITLDVWKDFLNECLTYTSQLKYTIFKGSDDDDDVCMNRIIHNDPRMFCDSITSQFPDYDLYKKRAIDIIDNVRSHANTMIPNTFECVSKDERKNIENLWHYTLSNVHVNIAQCTSKSRHKFKEYTDPLRGYHTEHEEYVEMNAFIEESPIRILEVQDVHYTRKVYGSIIHREIYVPMASIIEPPFSIYVANETSYTTLGFEIMHEFIHAFLDNLSMENTIEYFCVMNKIQDFYKGSSRENSEELYCDHEGMKVIGSIFENKNDLIALAKHRICLLMKSNGSPMGLIKKRISNLSQLY